MLTQRFYCVLLNLVFTFTSPPRYDSIFWPSDCKFYAVYMHIFVIENLYVRPVSFPSFVAMISSTNSIYQSNCCCNRTLQLTNISVIIKFYSSIFVFLLFIFRAYFWAIVIQHSLRWLKNRHVYIMRKMFKGHYHQKRKLQKGCLVLCVIASI